MEKTDQKTSVFLRVQIKGVSEGGEVPKLELRREVIPVPDYIFKLLRYYSTLRRDLSLYGSYLTC